jgi:hypothetical protein
MKKSEKRARTRINYPEWVRLKTGNESFETSRCRDLSLKGAFLEGSLSIDTGTVVEMDILFIESRKEYCIHVKGTVVRKDSQGIAVAFSEMDEESFSHLRRMVEYRCGDADKIEGELSIPAFERD